MYFSTVIYRISEATTTELMDPLCDADLFIRLCFSGSPCWFRRSV